MNPDVPLLARNTFLQAVQPGFARESSVVAAALAELESTTGGEGLNLVHLEKALDAEFPWRNQLVFQSRQPRAEELEAWIQVIRWLLESLIGADVNAQASIPRIQVLLTALGVLDVGCAGIGSILDRLADSYIPGNIVSILETFEQVPRGFDAQSTEWLREMQSEVKTGNFRALQQVQRAFQPLFQSDIWTSVFLLRKLEPTKLSRLIQCREDIWFDLLVCAVLAEDAPRFALQVESVTFKFISLSWVGQMEQIRPEDETSKVLEQMLLQVAKTPLWKAWLQATYEHPAAGSIRTRALAEALTKLAESHWRDFALAIALSRYAASAEGATDIFMHVACRLGSKAHPLWSAAFERWDAWDYGRQDWHFFLSSPQICTFDFPVAMHYSHLPAAERNALERELRDAIIFIEQRWFSKESELCTERNRLASRLRLVRYGSALAAGGIDALPEIVQPDSDYAEVRYRYHDVNQSMARTMRR